MVMTLRRCVELAWLRFAELVDAATGRVTMSLLSAPRIVRQGARVLRARRVDRFDGKPAYPMLLVFELPATTVDAYPELFDSDGCRAIAQAVVRRVQSVDGVAPALAVVFERTTDLTRRFRAGCGSALAVADQRTVS